VQRSPWQIAAQHGQQCVFVARKYELKRRAEKQAETRRRIVEAAIEPHCINALRRLVWRGLTPDEAAEAVAAVVLCR